jgi:hypothetical protein
LEKNIVSVSGMALFLIFWKGFYKMNYARGNETLKKKAKKELNEAVMTEKRNGAAPKNKKGGGSSRSWHNFVD